MKEEVICSHCGEVIEGNYIEIDGQILCHNCADDLTAICDYCGSRIWRDNAYGDDYTDLCSNCYHNHYSRCCCCDALVHESDVYHLDGDDYCHDCYDEECDKMHHIHDYGYKPNPQFYGDSDRYFGIELEIDGAGKDDGYAEELLDIANEKSEHIYIKSDGSLNDGMEIVSHPMSLDYHREFCWYEIMKKAVNLGYRSHQTSTCGLHIHVNRDSFSDNQLLLFNYLY